MPIASATMSPRCYGNDCSTWGPQKLNDTRETGLRSLGVVEFSEDPYVQLDLGSPTTAVQAVKLVARADCCLHESQNVYVYLSPTPDFRGSGSALCAANITFSRLGEASVVLCPLNTSARYVTAQKNGTLWFSLQEFVPLMDSKWQAPASGTRQNGMPPCRCLRVRVRGVDWERG
jgi:hypothetical protein